MLLAALGDIHGNEAALNAVLEAIDEAGIHTILNTGDCVVGHPWPNQVIECLRDRAIVCVQGEVDRLAVYFHRKQKSFEKNLAPELFDAVRTTYENTRSDNLEFLHSLPRTRSMTIDGIPVTLCHGVPAGQHDSLEEDDDLTKFQRQRELCGARILICGRTHRAYQRWVDDMLVVNPGSVGIPQTTPHQARYAIIQTEQEPWTAELCSVAY